LWDRVLRLPDFHTELIFSEEVFENVKRVLAGKIPMNALNKSQANRYFPGKHPLYVLKYFFAEYQFGMEVFTESLFGDI